MLLPIAVGLAALVAYCLTVIERLINFFKTHGPRIVGHLKTASSLMEMAKGSQRLNLQGTKQLQARDHMF